MLPSRVHSLPHLEGTGPLWRRLRAEAIRWAALVVLKLQQCPGMVVDIVIDRALMWLIEAGR